MNLFDINKRVSESKRTLRIVFQVATVIAILYILRELFHQWALISMWRPDWPDVFVLIIIAVLYGASLFLLAEMWQRLLQIFSPGKVDRRLAYTVYAQTQIAKYLPGNLFHYVGRHIMLAAVRIDHSSVLKVSVYEILLMLCGALLVVFFATGPGLVGIIGLSVLTIKSLTLILLTGLIVTILIGLQGTFIQRCNKTLKLMLLSAGFFLCQSLIFLTICYQLNWEISLTLVFSSVLSWIIGFVIPGAPGGLGVREFSLYFLLKPDHHEASVLIVVALFRAVTITGDAVCFLIGRNIKKA